MVQTLTELKVSVYVKWWAKAPFHPEALHLTCFLTVSPFAFENPTNPSQQLTWAVLPQGFKDSPHPSGQAPTRDLLDCTTQRLPFFNKLMTYFCVEPLSPAPPGWLSPFKNFLASWGYKVSKEKAQLCLPQVTYLDVVLKGQTCSLSHEWINPILHFPLPDTIKQLRAFLGVMRCCRIWIPWYAALARLLFMLLLILLFGPCIIKLSPHSYLNRSNRSNSSSWSRSTHLCLHMSLPSYSVWGPWILHRSIPETVPPPCPIVSTKQLDESSPLSQQQLGAYLRGRICWVWRPKADEYPIPPWRALAFLHPEELEACIPAPWEGVVNCISAS
jgi:putative effector of murein hydrolase LrgA (UPF0299 family)